MFSASFKDEGFVLPFSSSKLGIFKDEPPVRAPSSSKLSLFKDETLVYAPSSLKSGFFKEEAVVLHESVEKFPKKFMFLIIGLKKTTYLATGRQNRPRLIV